MKNTKNRKKIETKPNAEGKKVMRRFEVSKIYLTISLIITFVALIAIAVCHYLNVPSPYYIWIVPFVALNCIFSFINWAHLIGQYAVPNDLFGRK